MKETESAQEKRLLTSEQAQQLAKVYQYLLSLEPNNTTAGRGEFGDLTQPAADDELPMEEIQPCQNTPD